MNSPSSCLRLTSPGLRIDGVHPPPLPGKLLDPFGLSLAAAQSEALSAYLELLLRWNDKINLIGPASAEACITRHFGESLYLSRCVDLHGKLLDIGSGAGFPGLALKIMCQDLNVSLLEPISKKRAFLKEVTRVCKFEGVTVLGDRLEGYAGSLREPEFDFATARAVGGLKLLVRSAAKCLKLGGRLCLWLGLEQLAEAKAAGGGFEWADPVPIPLSRERVILVGRRDQL